MDGSDVTSLIAQAAQLVDRTPKPELVPAKRPTTWNCFKTECDLAFHQRVRAGFLALAAAEPGHFAIVDASRPADEVATAMAAIADHLVGGDEPKRPPVRIYR